MRNNTKNYLEKNLAFLRVAGNLKNIYRYGNLPELNKESSADHSWKLSLLIVLFAKEIKSKINLEYALKLSVVHDIAEAITGDIQASETMINKKIKEKKQKDEAGAIKKLKRMLPAKSGKEIYDLWYDYETKGSKEAKFVYAMDKIEAYINWLEFGYKYFDNPELIAIYPDEAVNNFPELKPLLKFLKNKLKREYIKGGIKWEKKYEIA